MVKDYYTNDFQKNARKSQWYDDITRNLTKCPFCDLKERYVIAKKGKMVLTVNLFPYIDGHLMVIPKRHVENLEDITKSEWESALFLINIGIKLIVKELKIPNTNILYREGASSGMSLKHMHIHIFPITASFMKYEKQRFIWEFQDLQESPVDIATKLRKAMSKYEKD